ncbi:MAG TPA: SpoIID/LytB domain-containing protein [Firmicutes bacterium]|nr:SpoIID/LytB domain-containing protein [Bacillota bacterium]
MKKQRILLGLLLLALLAGGCSLLRRPEKAPPPREEAREEEPQSRVLQLAEAGKEPTLQVYIHETGETREMKFEEYLAGVVAAEMKTDWPLEALAAQAILARTFTLEAIKSKGGAPMHGTDACTLVEHFQAYDAAAVNDRVREAVEMSRGMVATYKGDYIKAWFSAYAGERTAMAREGLAFREEEPPYIKSVRNPGAKYAPAEDREWTAVFTKDQIRAALAELNREPGPVNEVAIAEEGPTGRAVTIRVDDVEVAGADFRIALGSTELKSILLDEITVAGDKVTFKGRGYGHGVGMCQWGAYALAKEGRSPEEIVRYYFKDVEIERLWK